MITVDEFFKIYDVLPRRETSFYVEKLRAHWCPFVKSKGLCDRKCSTNDFCAGNVLEMVSNIRDARSTMAVLTWRIRNQKARISEQMAAEEHEPIERNTYGEIVTGNVFSKLTEMIGD